MNTETWKSITGYEGLYEVSNLGRVKSLKFDKEKILKPNKVKGYLRVELLKNGQRKLLYVHRLVAAAFIPNPKGLPEVNHKDEDKTNNSVTNIEWVSRWDNMHFGTLYERISKPVEASKYLDFREICLRFASTAEAGRNGYVQQAVSKCCNVCFHREGNNKYRGLYWRFAS